MEATARRLRLVAALFVATLAVWAATASGATSPSGCGDPLARICVQVIGSSDTVTPSVASPNFVSYTVLIRNQGRSTATHATLTDSVGIGVFQSANPSTGTCSPGPTGVQCAFGSLASGAQVTVTILVKAPAQLPAPPDGITNSATVSIDESVNDNPAPDPKQDTFVASATTTAAPAGTAESLVPTNTAVEIDTDPTFADNTTAADPNIGRAKVPASNRAPFSASLDEVNAPFVCPKKVICRTGAWLHADIPGTFVPPGELLTTLFWNKSLVPKQQTTKNLAVIHTDCIANCSTPPVTEVISQRCRSATPSLAELPCLTDVVETLTQFRATVHSKSNGYMR